MSDPETSADQEEYRPVPPRKGILTRLFPAIFEGLHWLTERVISLLRLFVTVAMFAVVAFIIYNAWDSRNTVAVKPFQVPVSMGENNHKQAGRIIANLLNQHLLQAQDTLQEQLNINNLDRPVSAEEQVLIEGESIKLPETGITIDNVIEFISGIFGRKNLNGSVYFEPDVKNPDKHKLHLQITLRGRIISISEDDLGQELRNTLPNTQKSGLNIQLISAMLKARSRELLSIASEDYNLYYFCTRNTSSIEHKAGLYQQYFGYCQNLHDINASPDSLQALRHKLEEHTHDDLKHTLVGSVISYLHDESNKKQATLCLSETNRNNASCQTVNLAQAQNLPTPGKISRMSRINANLSNSNTSISYTRGDQPIIERIDPASKAIELGSLKALEAKCELERSQPASNELDIVIPLENQCFAPQLQQPIASPDNIQQANKFEGDATQLLRNGLYAEALVQYQEAISRNCNNATAWANMGILLSTANQDSGVRDVQQGQCALLRATKLNDTAGWMRHSLCVAQAFEAEDNLERFLDYESCQQARQLVPVKESVYDRLFFMEIADHYQQLENYDSAVSAYTRAMSNETKRTCNMHKVLSSLAALHQKQVKDAKKQACNIYQNSSPIEIETLETAQKQAVQKCETEMNQIAQRLECV